MKQLETIEKTLGENTFYLRPLPAMKAAGLMGDLSALAVPLLTSLAPLLGRSGENPLDINLNSAKIGEAFSGLSGDRLEVLLKKLLLQYKNVSVQTSESDKALVLTQDLLDELFCGEVQDLFLLAFEVIRLNFRGFFRRLPILSGGDFDLEKMSSIMNGTDSLT